MNQGPNHWKAKLDEEKVRGILAAQGTVAMIAERYGISMRHVYRIRAGRVWKHVARTKENYS